MHKINIKYLSFIAAGAISLVACNDIDSDERFIDLPPIEGNRVVLLEDYTGQSCPNCPEGHRIVEQLEEQYPGSVVAVSIHAGEFAIPASNPTYVGLQQPFCDDMSKARGVETYPAGVIDGVGPKLHADWPAAVRGALLEPAFCDVTIGDFSFDEESRRLSGLVTLLPGKTVSANLGIWIIEDGIVARQYNVNGDHRWDRKYVHDHVLRAYATASVWGDPISLNRDEETTRDFSVAIDPKWEVSNLSVVVFVTDSSTGAYIQTAKAHVN